MLEPEKGLLTFRAEDSNSKYTKSARPMLAGAHNNPQELINYIRNTPTLRGDEPARQRENYLLESR